MSLDNRLGSSFTPISGHNDSPQEQLAKSIGEAVIKAASIIEKNSFLSPDNSRLTIDDFIEKDIFDRMDSERDLKRNREIKTDITKVNVHEVAPSSGSSKEVYRCRNSLMAIKAIALGYRELIKPAPAPKVASEANVEGLTDVTRKIALMLEALGADLSQAGLVSERLEAMTKEIQAKPKAAQPK